MIFLNYNFLLKLKKIQNNSEITSPLIHGGQYTATLKPNFFSKIISNSYVTLKITQITLFFLNLVLKFQSYILKRNPKKNLKLEKYLKLHLFIFFKFSYPTIKSKIKIYL